MPVIREEIVGNGCKWAIWKINESIEELIQITNNNNTYIDAITRFQHDRRKAEYLSTRILLEHLTGKTIEISYLPNGKPYLTDHSFQISLTHTSGFAAAIIHPILSVGIDIETVSPRILKIKDRFLSTTELNNVDDKNEVQHLLIQWSAKETVFKAMGETEVDFKDNLHIESFLPKMDGKFTLKETRTANCKSYEVNYLSSDSFVLTWTVKTTI